MTLCGRGPRSGWGERVLMGCVAMEGDTKRMKRLDGERGCVSNSSELIF
jgi:hypothetical protein